MNRGIPKRNVTLCAFCEEDLQWLIKREDHLQISQGVKLIVNEVGHDADRKRADYQLEKNGILVATCEVKGPVRKSFFDLDAYGRNWTRPDRIPSMVVSQLSRAQTHPKANHYLALLFCLEESKIPESMQHVMAKVAITSPGSIPFSFRYRQVGLTNGLYVTIAITEIAHLN